MKKHHLASTILACTVAASLMVGAAYTPQKAYTDPVQVGNVTAVALDLAVSANDKAEDVSVQVGQAAEEQAAAQAEAERKAKQAAAQEANTYFRDSATTGSSKSASSQSASNSSSGSKSSASKSACTRTITIDGVSMSYTDSHGASSAPGSGAGIWMGSDSTTDGSYGYYIGHNPGSFAAAANAGTGSKITVNDSDGNSRTYTVVDTFVVSRGSTWDDVSDRVTSHGESVALQTCVEGGYKIVIAE